MTKSVKTFLNDIELCPLKDVAYEGISFLDWGLVGL